jgi:hypothetical protein
MRRISSYSGGIRVWAARLEFRQAEAMIGARGLERFADTLSPIERAVVRHSTARWHPYVSCRAPSRKTLPPLARYSRCSAAPQSGRLQRARDHGNSGVPFLGKAEPAS